MKLGRIRYYDVHAQKIACCWKAGDVDKCACRLRFGAGTFQRGVNSLKEQRREFSVDSKLSE